MPRAKADGPEALLYRSHYHLYFVEPRGRLDGVLSVAATLGRSSALRRPDTEGVDADPMEALKAHVKNGRLVLDEPTELRDAEVRKLIPVDVLANAGNYLDDEETGTTSRVDPAWARRRECRADRRSKPGHLEAPSLSCRTVNVELSEEAEGPS